MNEKQIVPLLRIAKSQKNRADENRQATSNDIAGIKLAMDEAIDNEGDLKAIRDLKHERTTKESYRKQLNSMIHKLEGSMDDILFGKGNYDKNQLTFFDDNGDQVERSEKDDEDFFGEKKEKEPEVA